VAEDGGKARVREKKRRRFLLSARVPREAEIYRILRQVRGDRGRAGQSPPGRIINT